VGSYPLPASGEPAVIAYKPIDGSNWALLTARPKADAYADLRNLPVRGGILFLIAVFFAVSCAAFLAQKLTSPVSELTLLASEIEAGHLGGKVRLKTGDELENLGDAFNSMSGHLEDEDREVRAAREQVARKASQLQDLLGRMLLIRDEERHRISMDLHDGAVQIMVGALYQVEAAMTAVETGDEAASDKLESARCSIDSAVCEIRQVIAGLHSSLLDDRGIAPAFQQFVSDYSNLVGEGCRLRLTGAPRRFAPDIEITLFRIVQEALGNAWNHSKASQVCVSIRFAPTLFSAVITDNGSGFDVLSAYSKDGMHLGLNTMRERAQTIGARFRIRSSIGRGTRVSVHLQLVPDGFTADSRNFERTVSLTS
jgi:signal transduction histidine kinase